MAYLEEVNALALDEGRTEPLDCHVQLAEKAIQVIEAVLKEHGLYEGGR